MNEQNINVNQIMEAESETCHHKHKNGGHKMNEQSASVDQIMELERETCRRFQDGDIDWAIGKFANDFVLLNQGSEILIGKEHERKALIEASNTEGLEMFWEPTAAHVSASEDLAYVYGMINVKTPDGAELSQKYVTIWKKIHGEWKLALQISNSNE